MNDDLVCAHFSLARSCLVCELEAELAAERARADRAEINQSNAERIARVWMETAKKMGIELTEVRREAAFLQSQVNAFYMSNPRGDIVQRLRDALEGKT